MSFDVDKLYALLPAVHRQRDAEQGYPLRQLLDLLADQVAVLEEELDQLYDNQFVETAAPWALPYLGDLLGIRGLPPGNLAHSPRAEVARTVAWRRRKGTAAMLEELAFNVTGWPARAVEFFQRLATTQHVNHVRPNARARAWISDPWNHAAARDRIQRADALEFVGSAFEDLARTLEVRRIQSGRGRWNLPNVGVFLWRLRAQSFTRVALTPVPAFGGGDALAGRRFRFHPLGLDAPLFNEPDAEPAFDHLAGPENLPLPITRRMLKGTPLEPQRVPALRRRFAASTLYYGRCLRLELPQADPSHAPTAIEAAQVVVCDLADARTGSTLTGWAHERAGEADGVCLLDPQRGRVVFPAAPARMPLGTCCRGFSGDIGGGEYARIGSFTTHRFEVTESVPRVAGTAHSHATIQDAVQAARAAARAPALVEVRDSGRYEEPVSFTQIDAGDGEIELRAQDGAFPTVFLRPAADAFELTGNASGTIVMNGLQLAGKRLRVHGKLGRLVLRHCTLVPHRDFQDGRASAEGKPLVKSPPEFCLSIESSGTQVVIEDSLLGGIHAGADVKVSLKNCFVDTGSQTNPALNDTHATTGAATWVVENCTVVGTVAIGTLELSSNSILLGDFVHVQRRQEGCVRFCWLPDDAQVPRRYRCLPDDGHPGVRPHFTSLDFAAPAYGQLSGFCPEAIRRGADDGGELGVFHNLFQPQREAHLRARLEEYVRLGLEAGVFYAT
jgi:hypothetical protein